MLLNWFIWEFGNNFVASATHLHVHPQHLHLLLHLRHPRTELPDNLTMFARSQHGPMVQGPRLWDSVGFSRGSTGFTTLSKSSSVAHTIRLLIIVFGSLFLLLLLQQGPPPQPSPLFILLAAAVHFLSSAVKRKIRRKKLIICSKKITTLPMEMQPTAASLAFAAGATQVAQSVP